MRSRWSAWARRRTCCAAMEAAVQKFVERPRAVQRGRGGQGGAGRLRADRIPRRRVAGQGRFGGRAVPAIPRRAGAGRQPTASTRPTCGAWNGAGTIRTRRRPSRGAGVRPGGALAHRPGACCAWSRSGDAEGGARAGQDQPVRWRPRQTARQPRIFWKICAGFFEALALACCRSISTSKRAASRVLLQYASLAKGEVGVSDRLAQDLVFFCSQAVSGPRLDEAPALRGGAAGLGAGPLHAGRLPDRPVRPLRSGAAGAGAQAHRRRPRKPGRRLSGGDAGKLKGLAEQFHMVGESLHQAASGQRAAGAGADRT